MLTTEEVNYRLEEWAIWQAMDPTLMAYSPISVCAKTIKPEPEPPRMPIDDERAFQTDRALAGLPGRIMFRIRLHYLDPIPLDAKARRLGVGREAYKEGMTRILRIVAERIDRRGNR